MLCAFCTALRYLQVTGTLVVEFQWHLEHFIRLHDGMKIDFYALQQKLGTTNLK